MVVNVYGLICPVLSIFSKTPVDCVNEQCAWWTYTVDRYGCAVRLIAELLYQLKEVEK